MTVLFGTTIGRTIQIAQNGFRYLAQRKKKVSSDSERKAAEQYVYEELKKTSGYPLNEKRLIALFGTDFYLAGVAHTKKELEQVAREVYRAGWYTAASYEHPAFLEESIFVKAFQDYWQKKTESKEADEKAE